MTIPADVNESTNSLIKAEESGSPATIDKMSAQATTNENYKSNAAKETEDYTNNNQKRNNRNYSSGWNYVNFIEIFVYIGIPLVLSAIYLNYYEVNDSNKAIQEIYMDINYSLIDLHHDMSQSRFIWVKLRSQMKSVMVEKPSQPAVIIVVVPQGAQRTAACFVNKVATVIVDAFDDNLQYIEYDLKTKINEKDQTEQKTDLHETLEGLSTNKVAIIQNIELMSGHTASTFHAYCDNINAPHKQAVLLLTMEINSSYEDINEDELEKIVDNQLMKKWSKDLRETDAAAIISRMANSVILIKPEHEHILSKLC